MRDCTYCRVIMINVMASRLQLSDTVVTKAVEYQRLVGVKCSSLLKQYSENCISIICLQLASHSVGVQFDKTAAVRLSGVRKTVYGNVLQSVEKFLQLETTVGIKELSIKMGCVEVESLAKKIFARYCKVVREKVGQLHEQDLDFTNPKFSSAALYSATKLSAIKVDKNKFLAVASCSRKEFQSIVDIMMDYEPTKDNGSHDPVQETEQAVYVIGEGKKPKQQECIHNKAMCSPRGEEYLAWKKRIIERAEAATNNPKAKKQRTRL